VSASPQHAPSSITRVVAIIPARGGSQGVPLKNLQPVGGRPLVTRAVDAARRVAEIDLVVVSTDHSQIATAAEYVGAEVVDRPPAIASGTASSESALLHALTVLAESGREPEVVVFVQATSPFIEPLDLAEAVRRVVEPGGPDVVFSAAPTHDFAWRLVGGAAQAVGHDAAYRPRRQDREPLFRETGAFYVMRTAGFLGAGHRFFGRVELQVVDPTRAIEIDEPEDLRIARLLDALPTADAIDVDAVVTDFDGVHTDDRATVDTTGTESVRVHRGDGLGVARLRQAGIPLLILSTETNPVVAVRADKLGAEYRQGVDDKAAVLDEWLAARGLDARRVAYLGNDVNDLPALRRVGWPVAVADAHPDVVAAARVVLSRPGGHGAVRELADRVLAVAATSPVSALPRPRRAGSV